MVLEYSSRHCDPVDKVEKSIFSLLNTIRQRGPCVAMKLWKILGYVHTNLFLYPSVFDPTRTDTNIRVHTSVFELFSTVVPTSWETDYRVHDVIVFENVFRRFRPSTLIRKTSVFKNLHLGRRFRKPPFSWVNVSVFHRISVVDR